MLKCPKCGNTDNFVINSRGNGVEIMRRRECEWCGFRFTTYEMIGRESKSAVLRAIKPKLIANIRDAIIESFQDP